MFLFAALYFIAEVMLVIRFFNAFGFINTIFALLAGFVLGTGIIRNQGRFLLMKVQQASARGEPLSDPLLHSMMIFLSGMLFILPGFISDVIAIFLLLPGTRHLFIALGRRRLERQFRAGGFRVFTFNGTGGFSTGFGQSRPQEPHSQMRDVSPKVIDVKPISSESHVKEKDEPES